MPDRLAILLRGAKQNPEVLVLVVLALICHAAWLQFPTWQSSLGFLQHAFLSGAILLAGASGPAVPTPPTKDPQHPENPS